MGGEEVGGRKKREEVERGGVRLEEGDGKGREGNVKNGG